MNHEPSPNPLDMIKWLAAYPKLKDGTEKTIWWAVFKNIYLGPLALVLVTETVWHAFFHFVVGW